MSGPIWSGQASDAVSETSVLSPVPEDLKSELIENLRAQITPFIVDDLLGINCRSGDHHEYTPRQYLRPSYGFVIRRLERRLYQSSPFPSSTFLDNGERRGELWTADKSRWCNN